MLFLAYYLVNDIIGSVCYFCLLAYKLKLRLQLENLRLKQLSAKPLPISLTEWKLMRIITRIFKIHEQIKDENEFWSKWLFIQMGFISTFLAVFINSMFYNETNMLVFVFLSTVEVIFLIYIYLLNISCIKLHNEANISLKIILKLNFDITQIKMSRIIFLFKVNILYKTYNIKFNI